MKRAQEQPVVPVAVELFGRRTPIDARAQAEIVRAVGARIDAMAETLGLPVTSAVTVTSTEAASPTSSAASPRSSAAIRILVNGSVCRYPARSIAIAIDAVAGAPSESQAGDPESPPLDIDAVHLPEVVALTCAEAVRLRPSALLTPEVIAEYARRLESAVPDLPADVATPASLHPLVAAVVDLGIGVADLATVGRVLAEQDGAAVASATESLIGELAAHTIGLLVPDDLRPEFDLEGGRPASLMIAQFGPAMFEETGIVLPRISIETADLPPGTFAVRINDLVTMPTRQLPADRCLVNETVERLTAMGYAATPAVTPGTDQSASLVSSQDAAALEQLGFTIWSQTEHMALHPYVLVRADAGVFVSQDRLLAQLDTLEVYYPEVVRAARAYLGPDQLTVLVRKLAADRVPLRDLIPVLERIVDLPAQALGDERFTVLTDPVYSASRDESSEPDYDTTEVFVRTGLRHHIAQRFASDPRTLVCYLLDEGIERLAGNPDRSEADEDAVLDAIAAELAFLPPNARVPVILTSAPWRARLRDLLHPTYPLLAVVAFEDLPSTLLVQPVARIALVSEEAVA